MKINFRKVAAVASSALMVGMTMGMAAATSYPAPFVSGGSADVAIVYGTGTGVSSLDLLQAGNIQTNLQANLGGAGSTTSTSTTGDVIALDTSSSRIWLNTSLNVAKASLSKSDLPVVLKDYTFSGNVDAKLTASIEIGGGSGSKGADNSGVVIFSKQPKSSNDPVVVLSMGSNEGGYLYNASFTSKAINFTSADSEGENIYLFGKDFVISTATTNTTLVLFSSAQEVTLTAGGANPVTSTTLNIGGTDYTVTLVSGSDTDATIKVGTESKEVNEGSSKKIGGIEVAIKSVDESTALDTVTATILVGSEKMSFARGSKVTKGADDDPVDGTYVTWTSTDSGTTSITDFSVSVFRPSSSDDAILAGEPFIDPVFGSFKVDFQGINYPVGDANREEIKVENAGDNGMSLTFTDSEGNVANAIDIAYNASGRFVLGDSSYYNISVREMANLSENAFVVVGNEDYGHLLQVTQIYNDTSATFTNDKVTFEDVLTGEKYSTVFTRECAVGSTTTCGTLSVDGKTYSVYKDGDGDTGWVFLQYPTSDSAATEMVLFPTIDTKNGARIALIQPVSVDLGKYTITNALGPISNIKLPDGDGYTDVAITFAGNGTLNQHNITIGGVLTSTGGAAAAAHANVTVGDISYTFFRESMTTNVTTIAIKNVTGHEPSIPAYSNKRPGILIFEGKNDDNAYRTIYVDFENAIAGTSSDGTGVDDVYFSSKAGKGYWSASLQSDSDVEQEMDWFGTLVTSDSNEADQKTVTISYPPAQVYAQIFVGEESAVISTSSTSTTASSLGEVLVKDSEVSSVSTKNLIIVGGSCINSAAATLLGSAYCTADFTTNTGIGSGEFLIQSFGSSSLTSSGKVALLVAGYDAADTVNAAKFLTTQTVDTTAGKKYKGTSATSAEIVTA